MGRRCRSTSSPLAVAALPLLLLLVCFSRPAAAARLLPLQPEHALVGSPAHHANNGVTAAAAADSLVIQKGDEEAAATGDELSISESESEMMMGEEGAACEDAGNDDECLQRRLLLLHVRIDYAGPRTHPPKRRP